MAMVDLQGTSIQEGDSFDVGLPRSSLLSSAADTSSMPGQHSRSPRVSPAPQRKIHHVHKLEKKLSSSDLHSRLKTRKLLGVGETDDGDVHRSKLSQILGHSEQLYIRLPRGLVLWQLLAGLFFSLLAVWALLFPRHLFHYALSQEAGDAVVLPTRLYGAALIGYVLLFWNTLGSSDREVIRWTLLSSSTYLLLQAFIGSIALLQYGIFREKALRVLGHHFVFGVSSVYYYYAVGQNWGKIRRSASNRDVSMADRSPTHDRKKDQ